MEIMNRLAELLGSSARANIVEALALSNRPLTSYRVSKMYNMNVPRVYIEMKKLATLGLLCAKGGRRGLEYTLVDENLRSLALKLSTRVITYDSWNSSEAKAQRFRNGLIKVPRISLKGPTRAVDEKPSRMPGELENLALLARTKFDAKYRRISSGNFVEI